MKTVLRLVFAYFTCTPLTRALSAIGLVAVVALGFVITYVPYSGSGWGALAAVLGSASLFLGSMFMPLMLGRIARGRYAGILPGGRAALFWSAFVTVVIVSLPIPILGTLVNAAMWSDTVKAAGIPPMLHYLYLAGQAAMFFAPVFFLCSWLYVALWFAISSRSVVGVMRGMLVLIVVIYIPAKSIESGGQTTLSTIAACVLTWFGFAAFLFLMLRVEHTPTWARLRYRLTNLNLSDRVTAGREMDLMLGTASPWLLAIPIMVPVVLSTTVGAYSLSAWLFLMTIFSTVSGAVAARAAARSRAIWLRTRYSRVQLFAQVERRFWRHNGTTLASLIVLLLAIGWYGDLPADLLSRGIPLMVLGMVLSTYLGLMQTRGLRLADAAFATAIMLTLMFLSVAAAEGRDFRWILAVELSLGASAVVLRYLARTRWSGLDWRCVPAELGTAARSPA